MSERVNKLTIYLVKSEFTEFDEIAKDGLKAYVVGTGTFYMTPSHVRPPEWISEFFGASLPEVDLRVSSARGLFLTQIMHEAEARIFAVTFGSGRFMLRDGVIEERFGLRVTLNSVVENSLRSIDKVSLGATSKQSREQISRAGGAESFGIDIEQDLINSATGISRIAKFGKVVSGKDSFAVSAKFGVEDIGELLQICLERYAAIDYQEHFDWIDHIRDTRDKGQISALDVALMDGINSGNTGRIWLVPPEIIDWSDVKGFRHVRPKRGDLEPDLALQALLAAIGEMPLKVEILKQSKIHLISAKTDDVLNSWSAYRCIYAELEFDNRFFILNSAKWYEVDSDFTQIIKRDFTSTPNSTLAFIEYTAGHVNEGAYNVALSESIAGSCCMDAKAIPHGGGKSSIEFCDVLTKKGQLVHVKRYSGSGQLSHLFAQGVTSAEVFAADSEFRKKLNVKLPEAHKIVDPLARPDTTKFEVVYGIISKSAKNLDIPFFSKVTLKNAKARLMALGYKVSINKITAHIVDDGDVIEED